MTEAKSKFVAFIDSDANAQNRRPSMKGELARADGTLHTFALWTGEKKDGSGIYLKGKVQPKDTTLALKQQAGAGAGDIEQPAGLTLAVGDIVLFENDKGDNAKRPDFYGFSRTADGINRHSAWSATAANGSLMLRGSTEAWTANADAKAEAAPVEAERPADAKAKVRQALAAKR